MPRLIPRLSTRGQAIAFMILFCASFSLMSVMIRLAAADISTTVMVFWRNFFCIFLLLPFMVRGGREAFRTTRVPLHIVRAALGIVGMELWFYSLSVLPLNQATALSYTSPLFTTLFAVWYLKEKLTRARLVALAIGFVGAMVILRPDPAGFDARALIVLLSTALWAIAGVTVKSLTSTEPPLRIVFFMSIMMSLFALPLALMHWEWPDPALWGWILAIAVASLGSQLSIANAFRLADVAGLMPYEFARLIFTALLAWAVFAEPVDLISWAGAGIIVISAVYVTRREGKG